MSRLDKYRKLRNGLWDDTHDPEVETEAHEDSEPEDVPLCPDAEDAPVELAKPAKIGLEKPKSTASQLAKKTAVKFKENYPSREKPESDSLFLSWDFWFSFLGFGIFALAMGWFVFFVFGALAEMGKSNHHSAANTHVKAPPRTYVPPSHRTLDFFITDDGKLINNPAIENLKRVGTVLGTDPVFLVKWNHRSKSREAFKDLSNDPMRADYTKLILKGGDTLPVDIAMPWLMRSVDLYTAQHRYTKRVMICLARPVNRCAYPYLFNQ